MSYKHHKKCFKMFSKLWTQLPLREVIIDTDQLTEIVVVG